MDTKPKSSGKVNCSPEDVKIHLKIGRLAQRSCGLLRYKSLEYTHIEGIKFSDMQIVKYTLRVRT